ncbi:hypothetical protein [Microbispora catharanthi]|uniref:Uncharacterized protein n=1 Tax=Microbispora catharanthi TaxID=1712871 RepID=A0A5N6B507_9ACTN|nr:hypothetical protein [Microbispora catharanthi]KAB8175412.1 hypothetical protein FH610_039670 [Microbispora catharanthi]
MSLTNDLTHAPAEPRTVIFGPVTATADYKALRVLTEDKYPEYFNRVYTLFTGLEFDVWSHIAQYEGEDKLWLAHALYLFAKNKDALPAGFDHTAAVARLMNRATQRTAMPGAQDDAFEREVLRAAGWVSAMVVKNIAPPDRGQTAKLNLIFNPPGSDQDGDGGRQVGPLRKNVIKELIDALAKVVDEQLLHWVRPKNTPAEPESLDHLKRIADYLQKYVARVLGPYADAREDGPYFDGFRYSERLQSTWQLPAGPDERLNWMVNRAQAIGWDKERGALLAKADYDGARDGDHETLRQMLRERLEADQNLSRMVGAMVKLTTAHSGGEGKISVQPIFPSPVWGTKADWRWRVIRSLTHELMHRLAHPGFTAAADRIRHGQIVSEGFVDLLALDVYTRLWGLVSQSEAATQVLLKGVGAIKVPDPSFLKVGYGEAGTSAAAVRDLVGDDRVRAAFFLGATHLVGLPPA